MLKRNNLKKYIHTLSKKAHVYMTQPISFVQVFKWGVFTAFAILFIGNSVFYQSLAHRIKDELIRAYSRPDSPLSTFFEVTRKIAPTIVIQQFSLEATPTSLPRPTRAQIQAKGTISEDELWQALKAYRTSHGKKELSRSDSLCRYARSRAKELSQRLATHPDDPLDSHAGFKRDADSGVVFEQTGFNQVGENLAYTPTFTTGTQVIEWGWDTSSGHRALQLSDDITHGCISGVHPIYVGIFGS